MSSLFKCQLQMIGKIGYDIKRIDYDL